jgi:hypothetical protein
MNDYISMDIKEPDISKLLNVEENQSFDFNEISILKSKINHKKTSKNAKKMKKKSKKINQKKNR